MTLFMVGIGLWDEKDITLKGLEAVRRCDKIFLECYTSKLGAGVERLEKLYGNKIILADRDLVERNSDNIIQPSKAGSVAFLVIGDVFSATTHTDLYLRAKQAEVDIIVINNASILNSVGIVGLELYKFGKTTSVPFHNKDVQTPYLVIKENKISGLHTLLLLDIQAEDMKFMTINQAIKFLLLIGEKRKDRIFTRETHCIGVARLGSDDLKIIYGKASKLLDVDFGGPLHSLIVPGKLHFMEKEALNFWKL